MKTFYVLLNYSTFFLNLFYANFCDHTNLFSNGHGPAAHACPFHPISQFLGRFVTASNFPAFAPRLNKSYSWPNILYIKPINDRIGPPTQRTRKFLRSFESGHFKKKKWSSGVEEKKLT